MILDNYNIRFNTTNQLLEMNIGQETWVPVPGATAAVTAITTNGGAPIVGIPNFVNGTGVTLVPAGQNITVNATGTPAGSNSQVQFNNGGAFGGSPSFTFDPTDPLDPITTFFADTGVNDLVFNGDLGSALTFNNGAASINYGQLSLTPTGLTITISGNAWVFNPNGELLTPGPVITPTTVGTGTGTITPNAVVSSQINITVVGALAINGPTGGIDGQKIIFRLLQDGTGHTVTFNTGAGNFRFGTDIPTFTASGINLTDYVGVIFNSTAGFWDIVSVSQGF